VQDRETDTLHSIGSLLATGFLQAHGLRSFLSSYHRGRAVRSLIPREGRALLREHYHKQRQSENVRSGIEGSSTQCECSATLRLSCLTTEEERTIAEQHEELDAQILEHYEEGLERDRLLRGGAGRLEYLRTRELLARYLPPPPATVLDVGGGAGVYALPLAREGYWVNLIDPVPLHVDQARKASALQRDAPLASAEVGDARRLAWDDDSVEAVLLLGPLYHLSSRE
jgi:hypothetical protein